MKSKILLSTIFLFLVAGTGYGLGFQRKVHVQREFDLRASRAVVVKEASLKLTFDEMVEDSRCPEGVNCIWAGNGKIKLTARQGNRKSVTFELNTMAGPKTFDYQGYEISLIKLAPYPKANVPINKHEYTATLKVSRKPIRKDAQEPVKNG